MMDWRIVYVKVRKDGVHYKLKCTKPMAREVIGFSTESKENVVTKLFKTVKRLNIKSRGEWGVNLC